MKQIKVRDDIHQKLMDVKSIGDFGSLSEVIEEALQGFTTEEEIIQRDGTAFILESIGFGNVDDSSHPRTAEVFERKDTKVSFGQIANSQVGDVFESDSINYTFQVSESAEVIFRNDMRTFFVVLITTDDSLDCITSHKLLGISLL